MYWNLYRKYEVGKDESQRLEHIEDILHRNEEPVSRDHKEIGKEKPFDHQRLQRKCPSKID